MSSSCVIEAFDEVREDGCPRVLAFRAGVIALGVQGGCELDCGLEEGAAFANNVVGAFDFLGPSAVPVAQHSRVFLAQVFHVGSFSIGG